MTASRRLRTAVSVAACATALALGAALSGCTPEGPAAASPSPSLSVSDSADPVASATPTPDPAFVPGGSAAENRPYFDFTNTRVVAATPSAKGRDFVDALAAAGFDTAAMELTADTTSIGLDADSVQFSVKIGEDCLIGQYGPKSGGYHSVVAKPIATGRCLVGQTVPVDG